MSPVPNFGISGVNEVSLGFNSEKWWELSEIQTIGKDWKIDLLECRCKLGDYPVDYGTWLGSSNPGCWYQNEFLWMEGKVSTDIWESLWEAKWPYFRSGLKIQRAKPLKWEFYQRRHLPWLSLLPLQCLENSLVHGRYPLYVFKGINLGHGALLTYESALDSAT